MSFVCSHLLRTLTADLHLYCIVSRTKWHGHVYTWEAKQVFGFSASIAGESWEKKVG